MADGCKERTERQPHLQFTPRPRGFELPTFPSPLPLLQQPLCVERNQGDSRLPPSNLQSWFSFKFPLCSWALHLPLPTAAALLLDVVVGNTHAPGIRITALTRISWTSSVFTKTKITTSMAVFRKRRMRCFCVWLFPLVVAVACAQR